MRYGHQQRSEIAQLPLWRAVRLAARISKMVSDENKSGTSTTNDQ